MNKFIMTEFYVQIDDETYIDLDDIPSSLFYGKNKNYTSTIANAYDKYGITFVEEITVENTKNCITNFDFMANVYFDSKESMTKFIFINL